MTMAANLMSAGLLSYDQASLGWYALTLKTQFRNFCTAVAPLFSDTVENDRPVGNWLIPMWALSSEMTGSIADVSEGQFNQVAQYLWAMCQSGFQAKQQGRITAAQSAALLAAWNLYIGT